MNRSVCVTRVRTMTRADAHQLLACTHDALRQILQNVFCVREYILFLFVLHAPYPYTAYKTSLHSRCLAADLAECVLYSGNTFCVSFTLSLHCLHGNNSERTLLSLSRPCLSPLFPPLVFPRAAQAANDVSRFRKLVERIPEMHNAQYYWVVQYNIIRTELRKVSSQLTATVNIAKHHFLEVADSIDSMRENVEAIHEGR